MRATNENEIISAEPKGPLSISSCQRPVALSRSLAPGAQPQPQQAAGKITGLPATLRRNSPERPLNDPRRGAFSPLARRPGAVLVSGGGANWLLLQHCGILQHHTSTRGTQLVARCRHETAIIVTKKKLGQ